MKNIIVEKLEKGDFSHFSGTDIPMNVPISQALLNEQLQELRNDTLLELTLSLHEHNMLYLNFAAKVPIAGLIRRRIRMKMEGGIEPSGNSALRFHFLDGLKLLDKQLINFYRNKIAEVLPDGVHLSKDGCTVDLKMMMVATGYGQFVPTVWLLIPSTETGKLRLKLQLKV